MTVYNSLHSLLDYECLLFHCDCFGSDLRIGHFFSFRCPLVNTPQLNTPLLNSLLNSLTKINEWTLESITCPSFITRCEPPRTIVYYLVSIHCYETCVNLVTVLWFLQAYPLKRICYLANLFIAMDYYGFQESCHSIKVHNEHITFVCLSMHKGRLKLWNMTSIYT
jgi:hypothetical protein